MVTSNEDDTKREKLVERVRTSVIVFWILSIIFLIIGITVLSMYHNLNDSSQYAGTIAGTFFLVFSIPLIICSGFLTSALLIIQESIQDERDYRCRDPEFYKDVSSHFAYFFFSFNVLSVVQTITTFFILTFSSLYY
ncbi:unnamed protein product [Schistosoma mattheei]|uniref:Uncharacterized protein n=1 Tax=Schistosoma mattheei TaxID=31246 RepID=A0A183NHQ1_9TREM|nr:unnamed protein product [Schistosoma mattheei]